MKDEQNVQIDDLVLRLFPYCLYRLQIRGGGEGSERRGGNSGTLKH